MVTDVRPPESLATLAFIVAGELGLGLALGLSVATILSGLQLAGDMIDQQTGLAIGQIFNPGFEEMSGSVSSRLLFLLGTTLFVIAAPVGFHLRLLACLIDTFETLPPGQVFLAQSAVDTLSGLVHASLVFGFQIAAPVLAMLNLLALATGFLGHTVPQINILIIGFPLRIMAALLIFVLAFTAIGEAVLQGLETSLQAMRDVLLGTP
jgi:flagellar biosynthetic protein FliR